MKSMKLTAVLSLLAMEFTGVMSPAHAAIPEVLASFEVYTYQPGSLSNRSLGRFESEESMVWLNNVKGLYYLRPAEEGWNKTSAGDLGKALASQKVPGLDLTWEKNVTDSILADIVTPLSGLRVLYLEGTSVSDKSKDVIAKQRNLRVLSLGDGMTDESLAEFKFLPQLAELIVGSAKLTVKGVSDIGRVKTLRRLNLADAPQSAAAIQTLSNPRLDQLRVGASFSDASLAALKMKTLGLLDLGRTAVTDAGVASLPSFTRLHTLVLPKKMTDAGARTVGKMKNLRRLDLSGTQVTDTGLRAIAGLTQLEELSLAGAPVTDAGIDVLLGLPKLRMLDVSDTKLSGAGIKRLAALRNLQVLALSSQKTLTLADLKVFQGTPKLRTIMVNGKPASFAVVNYAKATGIRPDGTALGLDSGGKAPWPDSTMVEALPSAQITSRSRKGLGGGSGLYALHNVESDLDHVVPGIASAKINTQTETEENFLGEFTVNAGSSKKL